MASNDFVISTNLIVFGMSTFTGGQTFDGQMIVDLDNAEALLVRQDGDSGDVFVVDTNSPSATLPQANSFISLGPNASATGDIRFGNTRFIAWRNMNNNGDVVALSVDEDDFLNIGSAAALQARILSPSFVALNVGPHSIGTSPPQNHRQLRLAGNFVSGGQGTSASNLHMETDLTGFSGDTTFLAGFAYQGAITTQAVAEVIASVSSMQLDEPAITLGAGSSVTRASTLNITGHPTEGVDNFALIAAGPVEITDTDTRALLVSQGSFGNEIFFVDTTNDQIQVPTGSIIVSAGSVSAPGFTISSQAIWSDANAPRINNVASTATVPPIIPNRADTTTGIGGVSGTISLIAGSAEILRVSTTATDFVQVRHQGNFTSDGSSTLATKFLFDGGLIGAPGDITSLFGANFDATITTQTATENIADIAQVRIDEPSIADNLTGDITHASILLLTSSTVLNEGVNNWGIRALGAAPSVFQAVQFIIGRTTVDDWLGVIIGGQFTSGGGNTLAARVRTEGGMTGAPGDTSLLTGMWLDVSVATQIASETIGSISQIRIDEPAIADNLTGGGLITNAQTLEITGSPTEGVNNYALRSLGPAPTLFMGLQFVIGDFAVDDFHQVLISGSFTSGGGSDRVAKFRIEGNMTGASGDTGTHNGAYFDATIVTQTETENIADISQVRIDEPAIVDNLTGDITKAHTLFLVGSPTEGELNYALRSTGPAPSLFQGLQFVIGDFAEDDFWQVLISGSFTSGGSSNESAKLRIEGALTGADGDTAGMVGSYFDATFVTQTAVENIANISQCRFDGANITDNLTGDITNAQTLFITASPTAGEANWTIRSTALAPSIFQGLQFAIGRTTLEDWHQFVIGGAFTSGGSASEADKFKIQSTLTGAPGDSTLNGAFFAANITTQTATETIADIAQVKIFEPTITDNLTGDITRAQTLLLNGSPTEGLTNFALRSTGPARSMFVGLPFTIGTNIATDVWQVQIRGNFTSGGTSNRAAKFEIEESVIGVSGDTVFLGGALFAARVTTQTVAEVVTDVFQVRIEEPIITVGAGSSITNAQTLLIVAAPTEGSNNYALRVIAGDVLLGGNLAVSGAGPHAIGGTPSGIIGLIISETFTSDGAGTLASGIFVTQTLVGASGDTTSLTGVTFISAITTQTETESIANVSQVEINEPFITDNLTGDITNAQSLLIVNAPTEGLSNFALRVASGLTLVQALEIDGELDHDGSTVGFFGTTPATQPAAYTRNAVVVEDRTLLASASATTLNNNNVLAALIADLQSLGVIG